MISRAYSLIPFCPTPAPIRYTSLYGSIPNLDEISRTVVPKSFASPSSHGRPMRISSAPHMRAASSLAGIPPSAPESFVTKYFAPAARIAATFCSTENGPCIAMTFFPVSPIASHASSACLQKSTRTKSLSLYPGIRVYSESSLLPVATKMFPSFPAR